MMAEYTGHDQHDARRSEAYRTMRVFAVDPAPFARYLSQCRQQKHLSQQALAELAGCTRQYVGQLESGQRSHPSYRIATGLVNALGLGGSLRLEFLELAGYGNRDEFLADRQQLTHMALSTIDSMSYPAFIHDNLWRLYGWNSKAEELFGVSPSQIVLYSTSLMEFIFDPTYRHHIVPWKSWAQIALRQFRHDCQTILHFPSSRELMKRLRRLPDFRRMWNACDPVTAGAPLLPLTFHTNHKAIQLTIVRMHFPGPPHLWINVFLPLEHSAPED